MTLADLPAALPQELSRGAVLTAGMALSHKQVELGLDAHPEEGRHWGSAEKKVFGAGKRTGERHEHINTILFLPGIGQAAKATFSW